MRRPSRIHLMLVLVLASCSADTLTDPVQSIDVQEKLRLDSPFSARCDLAIQPGEVVGPGLIHQLDIGECQATHLGRAAYVSDKVINVVAGTQTLEGTYTAANGDVLRSTGTGTSVLIAPGRVAFTASITFTGGTGRFANATGAATIIGEADLTSARSRMTATGSLSY